ncbi:carbohydrate-binding protein [Streptomyces sp. NPDC021224]|uniref:carbohydrate-binding protein n=1 Tax=unclassified Streptomyces TaxID=2593676 RepID=UPI0037BAD0DD
MAGTARDRAAAAAARSRPPRPATTPTTPPTGGATWASGVAYRAGDQVAYGGTGCRCLQAHTAMTGWEPPKAPGLWQPV